MRPTRRPAVPLAARTRSPAVPVALAAALVARCGDTTAPSAASPAGSPVVGTVAVVPDSLNALASVVTFTVRNADSARVLYHAGTGADRTTPAVAVHDSAQIPILGLPAGVAVTARVIAVGGARADTSASVTGPVPAVPDVVRRVRLRTTSGTPSAGYVLTALSLGDTAYAVAFDSAGAVAWYRAFPGGSGIVDAYQQPNGDFTVYLGASHGYEAVDGYYAEVRPTGELVRQWRAPAMRPRPPKRGREPRRSPATHPWRRCASRMRPAARSPQRPARPARRGPAACQGRSRPPCRHGSGARA